MVKIGNGKVAMFWTSSWADGRTPKNITPSLFRKAKRKKVKVYKALQGNKWIAHVTPVDTVKELQEYVTLWEAVEHIQLEENTEDSIIWWWTEDGEYTTKSAYAIQFQGTFSKLKMMPIWKAKVEQKMQFFCLDLAA